MTQPRSTATASTPRRTLSGQRRSSGPRSCRAKTWMCPARRWGRRRRGADRKGAHGLLASGGPPGTGVRRRCPSGCRRSSLSAGRTLRRPSGGSRRQTPRLELPGQRISPILTLGAPGGRRATQFSKWYTWPSRFWSIGPELAGTLFDAGARRGAEPRRRGRRLIRRWPATGRWCSTRFNRWRTIWLRCESWIPRPRSSRAAVNSAKHLLDLAMTRYRTGD